MLEPDKSIHQYNIVNQSLRGIKYKEIAPLDKDVSDALTYYQSASYLYKHHLNQWKQ